MTTLFVSDLHLSGTRPEKIDLFRQLLAGPARQADALYILGDLFEHFWIGVDDPRPPNAEVIDMLKAYTQANTTKLLVMRGNRDFHLDDRFAAASGCQLIDDPTAITLYDEQVLLMHGDTLCTDDTRYQQWRRFIMNPVIKWLNLRLPISLRQRIATDVRSYTVQTLEQKDSEIIDVSQQTVVDTMRRYGIYTLIHGHTHRQAMHDVELNGSKGKRIVLGDWYEKDCVLVSDADGFRFFRIEDYIQQTGS